MSRGFPRLAVSRELLWRDVCILPFGAGADALGRSSSSMRLLLGPRPRREKKNIGHTFLAPPFPGGASAPRPDPPQISIVYIFIVFLIFSQNTFFRGGPGGSQRPSRLAGNPKSYYTSVPPSIQIDEASRHAEKFICGPEIVLGARRPETSVLPTVRAKTLVLRRLQAGRRR